MDLLYELDKPHRAPPCDHSNEALAFIFFELVSYEMVKSALDERTRKRQDTDILVCMYR